MNLIYISISGNTRSFAQKMQHYAQKQHQLNTSNPLVAIKEINENSALTKETEPFFAIVPTYLEGGNGVDNGDQEILTESLREYIDYADNAKLCLGILGSGNKNFNYQYCLTAKQYAEQFNVPMIADFELRGNAQEITDIYQKLLTYLP